MSKIYIVSCQRNLTFPIFSLLFRWIAILWLQTELDNWVKFKNTTAPRAVKNKILPRGVPALIRSRPSHFNAADFMVVYYPLCHIQTHNIMLDTCPF